MLDIRGCIEARKNYSIKKSTDDELLTEINSMERQKEIFFVVPEGFLCTPHNKQRKEFEVKYNIAGVFDIGQPFINTGVHMVLVQAVSGTVEDIKVAMFNGVAYDRRKNRSDKSSSFFITPIRYTDKFDEYIKSVENWINEEITPIHDPEGKCEYNVIPKENINVQKLYPKYYSRQNLEIRELLSKEETVLLSSIADILIPHEQKNGEEMVKRLRKVDMRYPLDIDNLEFGSSTSVIVQKGDIIFPRIGDSVPYLFNEDTKEKIYASPNLSVIKSNNISPEYLFFYLASNTAVSVLEAESSGTVVRHISIKNLADLPVVLPSQDEEKYRADFEILSSSSVRKYGIIEEAKYKGLYRYYSKVYEISKKIERAENIEDVLNVEIASTIKLHSGDQLRTFLADDLKELNICFRGKAYKAALILAGSILEAVLIDWLSEIHHKNYFESDYMVDDQRNGRKKRADLIDYINAIKDIERPRWMEEAAKAHEIRSKRNLVHAKLCLKSDDINEEVCKQVIDYLKDVLKTRGVE